MDVFFEELLEQSIEAHKTLQTQATKGGLFREALIFARRRQLAEKAMEAFRNLRNATKSRPLPLRERNDNAPVRGI